MPTGDSRARVTWTVSNGFFDEIGGEPMLGRMFIDSDYEEGRASILVLSHRAWAQRFGGDPGILGQPVILDACPLSFRAGRRGG